MLGERASTFTSLPQPDLHCLCCKLLLLVQMSNSLHWNLCQLRCHSFIWFPAFICEFYFRRCNLKMAQSSVSFPFLIETILSFHIYDFSCRVSLLPPWTRGIVQKKTDARLWYKVRHPQTLRFLCPLGTKPASSSIACRHLVAGWYSAIKHLYGTPVKILFSHIIIWMPDSTDSAANRFFGSASPFAIQNSPSMDVLGCSGLMFSRILFWIVWSLGGQNVQCQEIRKVQNAAAHLLNGSL